MSFDSEKLKFGREHIYIAELDLDYCSLTYGTGDCLAGIRSIVTTFVSVDDFNIGDEIEGQTSGAIADIVDILGSAPTYTFHYRITNGINFNTASEAIGNNNTLGFATKDAFAPGKETDPGDSKCFNTFESSQDPLHFTKTTKTYRFCEQRSPLPLGLPSGSDNPDVIPSIVRGSINISPAVINVKGGMGQRTSGSIRFVDHPHSDIDIDKYLDDRSWGGLLALERGTFWTKVRSRNPNYQFRALRILSGYLVDGVYFAENFETHNFIVDKLNVSNGFASLAFKDILKLATSKKFQVPKPSTGQLQSTLLAGVTSATLIPAGVGNSEYEASGELLIKSEVMLFTRAADALTLTRGQRNTADVDHSANDTVQQCYVANAQVNIIVKDWLENFADVDPVFIPAAAWQSEIDTYLNGLLDGIIVKPMDGNKALREIAQDKPHYLWWDERTQFINLTALKAPPDSADVLDMDKNLIANSVKIQDKPEMRISTVFVNFGQFDPTKKLDEPGNWEQSYVRVDTDSIVKYESNIVDTINSRWITSANKAAATNLAALRGRRFSNTPRLVNFSLDAKDSDVWIGQSRSLNHRDMVDFTGIPEDIVFEIISAKESKTYDYTGLEFNYGDEVAGDSSDAETGVDIVLLSINDQNINLRTIYDSLFPAPDASTKAKFITENGVDIGGASLGGTSMDTGSWPAGALVTLQTDTGSFVIGRGAKGQHQSGTPAAEAGSLALILNHDLTLINNGVIGGGGGGGGNGDGIGATAEADGGGGAGDDVGVRGGLLVFSGLTNVSTTEASAGTKTSGGNGGLITGDVGELEVVAQAGSGGDLGDAGTDGDGTAGIAGVAIDKNGFTLTEDVTGDIRGAIVA